MLRKFWYFLWFKDFFTLNFFLNFTLLWLWYSVIYKFTSVICKFTATTYDSKKYILDWLRQSLRSKGIVVMSNLFKTSFMPTALLFLIMHAQLKIENSTNSLWEILRTAEAYSNITKRYSLCLHEKLEMITYSYSDKFLNRRSESVTKCKHENKFLLKEFNSNEWSPY